MLEDRAYMRSPSNRFVWNGTLILLVLNCVAFVTQSILEFNRIFPVTAYLGLSLDGLQHGYVYQIITFQFLHASLWHLLGNLLVIYFFGRTIEEALGTREFFKLYFLSGTIGGLLQTGLTFLLPEHFRGTVVGASAGAFGLIAAFAARAPDQPITTLLFFILPVTFPAKVLLWIEGVLAIYGLLVPSGNVAHAAHLGGMLCGLAYIRWLSSPERGPGFWNSLRRPRPRKEYVPARISKGSNWRRQETEEELPSAEFISREVDPILDKISAHGIHSLTDRERRILEAARKKMAKR
jgi:membrane associated rhomboid family serine protease